MLSCSDAYGGYVTNMLLNVLSMCMIIVVYMHVHAYASLL